MLNLHALTRGRVMLSFFQFCSTTLTGFVCLHETRNQEEGKERKKKKLNFGNTEKKLQLFYFSTKWIALELCVVEGSDRPSLTSLWQDLDREVSERVSSQWREGGKEDSFDQLTKYKFNPNPGWARLFYQFIRNAVFVICRRGTFPRNLDRGDETTVLRLRTPF